MVRFSDNSSFHCGPFALVESHSESPLGNVNSIKNLNNYEKRVFIPSYLLISLRRSLHKIQLLYPKDFFPKFLTFRIEKTPIFFKSNSI